MALKHAGQDRDDATSISKRSEVRGKQNDLKDEANHPSHPTYSTGRLVGATVGGVELVSIDSGSDEFTVANDVVGVAIFCFCI